MGKWRGVTLTTKYTSGGSSRVPLKGSSGHPLLHVSAYFLPYPTNVWPTPWLSLQAVISSRVSLSCPCDLQSCQACSHLIEEFIGYVLFHNRHTISSLQRLVQPAKQAWTKSIRTLVPHVIGICCLRKADTSEISQILRKQVV